MTLFSTFIGIWRVRGAEIEGGFLISLFPFSILAHKSPEQRFDYYFINSIARVIAFSFLHILKYVVSKAI
jgi:hypothetical protein